MMTDQEVTQLEQHFISTLPADSPVLQLVIEIKRLRGVLREVAGIGAIDRQGGEHAASVLAREALGYKKGHNAVVGVGSGPTDFQENALKPLAPQDNTQAPAPVPLPLKQPVAIAERETREPTEPGRLTRGEDAKQTSQTKRPKEARQKRTRTRRSAR